MTAIRPRPQPEQQRREQLREEAQAHAEVAKANQILVSQARFPLVLAVFYIALLIVPWVLTCKIASQPSFIIHVQHYGYDYRVQHEWFTAINILNSVAAVLSLPILSALLARAAVVFSQRRKPGQTLSLRQLFALADRGWCNLFKVMSPVWSSALLRLGFLVLFIAFLLPLVRSALVGYDNPLVSDNFPKQYERRDYERPGTSPSPLAVKGASFGEQSEVITDTRKSLRTTVGGIEPNLWPVCNDKKSGSTCGFRYGPYDLSQSMLSNFWEDSYKYGYGADYDTNGSALMHASTFTAGSSIGYYYGNEFGAYALGLKSGTRCDAISVQDVEEQCLRSIDDGSLPTAARGWNTSLEIEGELRLDICYPSLEKSPWEAADASPWKPIEFTEHLYIGLQDEDSIWGCGAGYTDDCPYTGTSQGLYMHCQADSVMSFFELGSARTKDVPSRFLDEMPSGFDIPGRGKSSSRSDILPGDSPDDFMGPLKTATMAMFGNDSWLDTLNTVMVDLGTGNTTLSTALKLLCQMRPLGNIDMFGRASTCRGVELRDTYPDYYEPSTLFSGAVRDWFESFNSRKTARAALNTATFYANNALLSRMNRISSYSTQDRKYSSEVSEERMAIPVLSVAAIATVSVLMALQVVCVILLLVYIYSSRVWTLTLDALAMARVGAQLSALDVFLVPRETGTLGTARINPSAAKQLDQIDGLVGSTALMGQQHDVEMATMPPPYAPRGAEPSTREERRMPQPGADTARDTGAQDHTVPAYSPPADEHTTRAAGAEAGSAGRRDDADDMVISHAASSESQGLVLPTATSLDAIAVGGRGLIPRRIWRQADKPLPAPPAEQ